MPHERYGPPTCRSRATADGVPDACQLERIDRAATERAISQTPAS